jgi:signal recognition particle subunit SEC65
VKSLGMKKGYRWKQIIYTNGIFRIRRRRRGRDIPMDLSREFVEKFSEIFLEDTMADFFNMKQDSQ